VTFFEELQAHTAADRDRLLQTQVITDCLAGRVSRETYAAFLAEAYHHVKHTVPLLMACGSRLPARLNWLRQDVSAYIAEEIGHEQWILRDLANAGFSAAGVQARGPSLATELMVSYAYDTVQRNNPVGLFGMVFVLEGTSVAIATRAAHIIMRELDLPRGAFSYLLSHGSLDLEHIGHFETLVNRFDDTADRAAVLHCAQVMFRLYGDIFRALPRALAAGEPGSDTRAAA
jgi:pyrroloquinoline quinone (PQQ) biosynthesis protein C